MVSVSSVLRDNGLQMLKYILKRLSLLIPTLIGVATLVFAMVALSPGDPARVMLGERATKAQLEKIRAEMGLGPPIDRAVRHLHEEYGPARFRRVD